MRRLLFSSCVIATAAFAALGAGPALASGNCPTSASGALTATNVAASFTGSGNTATYTFSSLSNENSSGGIPGLIEVCVYPGTIPDSTTASALGANGSAWVAASGATFFTFSRADGDPSNIPLDGTSRTLGTATWSGDIPQSQTILLHLNDPDACNALYHQGPQSCYVLPSTAGTEVPAGTIGGLGLSALLGLGLVGSLFLWRRKRGEAGSLLGSRR